jgi:hypothetical protein
MPTSEAGQGGELGKVFLSQAILACHFRKLFWQSYFGKLFWQAVLGLFYFRPF